MEELKRGIKQAAEQIRGAAEDHVRGESAHINIAGRKHVAIARNVGSERETHGVSSTQHTRIRQRGGRTDEQTETITEESTKKSGVSGHQRHR